MSAFQRTHEEDRQRKFSTRIYFSVASHFRRELRAHDAHGAVQRRAQQSLVHHRRLSQRIPTFRSLAAALRSIKENFEVFVLRQQRARPLDEEPL